MRFGRLFLIAAVIIGGCGSPKSELPSKEKIQKQVEQDAARRAEEDRLEREQAR